MIKKHFLSCLLTLLPLLANAFDVAIENADGVTIYYNLVPKAKVAEVTSGTGSYSGVVNIPENFVYEGVEYSVNIGSMAFDKCTGLTSVTIPSNVTSIGDRAFNSCTGLTSVHINDLEAWCKISFDGMNSNPLCYAHHLFLNGEEVKDLIIPNSVTSIGNSAFAYCSSLTSVTIPGSVTSIGNYAFSGCTGLTSVRINDLEAWCKISFDIMDSNPLYYAHHLFLNSEEVKDLVIPNSVSNIEDYTFEGCTGLTSITIPGSVTRIGHYTFDNCTGLTSVHINDLEAWCKISFDGGSNPLYYAHHLFLNGEEIKDLIIPNSVSSIKDHTFEGCTGLTSITIPTSVTTIGNKTFCFCSGLTSITIPNSVTSIGSSTFGDCSSLTSITIPNSVTSIGASAFNGSGLTSITISNSVSSIENVAFANCSNLTSITIPNSVSSIGDFSFFNCSNLTSITIPNSVNSIGYNSFANCSNLEAMFCYAEDIPSAKANAFDASYIKYATLYVPDGLTDVYKNTAPWSGFGTIKTLDGVAPPTPDPLPQCATPTVNLVGGKLIFECETEGVEFVPTVSCSPIMEQNGNEMKLGVSFYVSVYAVREGYNNSNVTTKTIDAKELGDVNADGKLSIEDVTKLVKKIMEQ